MHASHTDATGCPCTDTLHVQMPISNLVECAVNLAEKVTGVDIDRDGDVGQRTSNESGAVTASTVRSPAAVPVDGKKQPDDATRRVIQDDLGLSFARAPGSPDAVEDVAASTTRMPLCPSSIQPRPRSPSSKSARALSRPLTIS